MTILFVLSRKKYSNHVLNIAIALFIMSLLLFSEIAEESNLVDSYPILLNFGIVLDLLIWPFLLFYIQYIVGKRSSYNGRDLLYFTPFVVASLWQLPYMLMSDASKLSYYSDGIPTDIAVLVGFKMMVSVIFLSYQFVLLRRAIVQLEAMFPRNRKAQFLRVIKRFSITMMVLVASIYVLFFGDFFHVFSVGDSDRIGSLIISGLFYYFGMLIFRHPHLLEESYSSSVKFVFAGKEPEHQKRLMELFESKKVHLNEKLTVQQVADQMDLSKQQLSYLVSDQMGLTIIDLINTFRVKEVQGKMKRGEQESKTLLGLALESGFNSKASFNRIFKNHTGSSPSEFFEKQNK